jgi:uncharacterized protein YuzE
MKISYDKIADAVYIRAKAARIKSTKKIQNNLLVDFDAKGRVRGIEILDASHWLQSSTKKPSIEIGNRRIPIPAVTR